MHRFCTDTMINGNQERAECIKEWFIGINLQ